MFKIKTVISTVAGLLLTASLFAAKAPDWIVNGGGKKYPSSKYYVSVGEASTKDGAELKAVEGIASIFGQNVKSSVKGDKRMAQIEGKGGDVVTTSTSTLSTTTTRQVDAENLIGIEIIDSFQDTANAKWYVLAVMDKPKTAQIYSDLISTNNDTIQNLMDNSINSADPYTLDSYSKLDFAVKLAKQSEVYIKKLSVIDPDSATAVQNSEFSAANINNSLRTVASMMPIVINVENDKDGRIGKAFEKALSSAGLNTVKGTEDRYQIVCSVYTEKSTIKNMPALNFTIDATLRDTFLGEDIIPLGFTGREGGNTEQQAESKAYSTIAKKIDQTFKPAFNDYLQTLSIN